MKKIAILLIAIIVSFSTVLTSCEAVKNTNQAQRGAGIGVVLGGVLGVIDFRLGVRGFVVFLERAIHVDGADFETLREGPGGERESRKNGNEDKLFHRCEVRQVVGMALDCKCHLSFKIGSQR